MRISKETMYLWDVAAKEAPVSDLIPARDYSGLNGQSEQLRIWLPECAKIGLMEVVKRTETNLTIYLQELFAAYLYGRHELLRMKDRRIGLYEPLKIQKEERYSAMEVLDYIPRLGKSLYAIKIYVSTRLKKDMEKRAEISGVVLGEFTRALICQHLFGREYGPLDREVDSEDRVLAEIWVASKNEIEDDDIEF